MKILITERAPGDAADAAHRLGAAGYELAYCHRPQESQRGTAEPGTALCAGVTSGGRCPLADGDIDVVVDARSTPGPVTAREFGAICALRHRTPLVVAGPLPDETVALWHGADVQCPTADVGAACEQAVSPTGPTAHRAAAEAARRVLRHSRHDAQLTVKLTGRQGMIEAFVTTNRPLPARLHEEIRGMIRAALAPYTPSWRHAQVIFLVHPA